MKLTNHEEYGLRCLLRLAEQGPGGTLTIPELSDAEGISEAYAGKLLRLLRRGGFVNAERGKVGGYALAQPADKILVADVMNILGHPLFAGSFCDTHAGQMNACVRSVDCSVRALWRTVQAAVDQVLKQTRLADLLASEQEMTVWARELGELEGTSPRPLRPAS